ncbi:MAG: hypothetical protein JSW34_04795 [Candidatus Zixiibacteriota bacterium]|nr:MAG: hypothetical protein JSW34_04795 [candidate division Zixibacteria bacterium]
MMKRIIAFLLVSAVFALASAQADSPKELPQDKKEIDQDRADLKQSRDCLQKLRRLTGKWHEANLVGDSKKAHQYEQTIVNLLVKDVNLAAWSVWAAENEVVRSEAEPQHSHQMTIPRYDEAADHRDDKADCVRARRLLEAKEHLLSRLKASGSFSYKYRLLADYQYLLEGELGVVRAELEEDVRELKEDKR